MALHNQEIAERLRELRGNRPQTVAAAAIEVSPRALQNWEAGIARPSWRNVEKLAEYYDVAEEFILTGGRRSLSRAAADDDDRPAPGEPTTSERLASIEEKLEQAASDRREITDLLARQTELLAKIEAATDRADAAATRFDESATRADQASKEALRRLEALQAAAESAQAGQTETKS